jgi:hypothetical protein
VADTAEPKDPDLVEFSFDWHNVSCHFNVDELIDELDDDNEKLLRATVPELENQWCDADAVRDALRSLTDDKFETIRDTVDELIHGGLDWDRISDCECSTFEWDAVTEWMSEEFNTLNRNHPHVQWAVLIRGEVHELVSDIEHQAIVDNYLKQREWTRLHVALHRDTCAVEYTLDSRTVEFRPFVTKTQAEFAEHAFNGALDVSYGDTPSALETLLTWPAKKFDLAADLYAANPIIRVADDMYRDDADDVFFADLTIEDVEKQFTTLEALAPEERHALAELVPTWRDTLDELVKVVKIAALAA